MRMPLKYPKSLITIADHLKKKRMDLQLFQEDVAQIVGVTTDCITNWENSRAIPQIQYMPSIIAFLGYNPASLRSKTFGDRIKEYRLLHGLSHKRMGKKLGVDGSTVSSWESGKFQPQPGSRVKVLRLLKDDEPAMT